MKPLSCAFFGHRNYDYRPYEDKIREVVVDLINRGVTEFYNGYRGKFDGTCARIVGELREQYPLIKNIMVLSYRPTQDFKLPDFFDESVYLLGNNVPHKYAITRTNKELVKTVDYIVSGVVWKWGGAKTACDYAKKLLRTTVNVVTNDNDFFCDESTLKEVDKISREYRNRLDTDEEYKKAEEERYKKLMEKVAPILEKQAQKSKKNKTKTTEN